MFRKATKKQAKLRFTFDGPAGSGKTYSSLLLAKALGGKVAVIDTEHGSASKYAHLFEFDSVELAEFSLETYLRAIAEAERAGYGVLIIDSLSHAWTGRGGALEQVDRVAERSKSGNKFTEGWKTVTPLHNQLIDAMLAFPGHVISTMRTKMEWVIEKDEKGRSLPRKIGLAPVQREGMEYEFDVIADLDTDGNLTISKTRCPALSGAAGLLKHADVPELGARLRAWLSDGTAEAAPSASVVPAPAPVPAAPTPSAPQPQLDFDVNAAPPPTPPAPDAPPTPEESEKKLLGLLQAAKSKAELERLTPALRALPGPIRDRLRPLWTRRLSEVTKRGGAHAVNG